MLSLPSVSRAVVLALVLAATSLTGCKRGTGSKGAPATGPEPPGINLYVGCASPTGEIQRYRLTSGDAALALRETVAAGSPASFSALHPGGKLLYVNHRTEGKISTFSIGANGVLALLGSVPVPVNMGQLDGGAAAPANPSTQTLEVDPTGKFLLAPNYEAHTTLVFGLDGKGTVGGVVSWHSAGMKAHHTMLSPDQRFVLVPYLASHLIAIYTFDAASGAIKPHTTVTVPGTTPGPRHLALHSNGKWLYVINETNGTLSLFNFDQATGGLSHADTVSAIQPDYTGALKNSSEVLVAPSGKFVYVSNRLDNQVEGSLGAFAVNPADGKVTPIGFQSSRGKTPRHFTLSPNGEVLVAANQNSNTIALFSVSPTTGALSLVRTQEVCATPFFVRFMAP